MPASLQPREAVDRLIAEVGVPAAGQRLGVAALLYTYRCTIACRHCCFGCAGERPPVRMTTEQSVYHLRQLHELGRVIHIAGGEAMLFWDDLLAALEAAVAEGVQPHFIESNASFATDDALVRGRYAALQANGVVGMLLSADPYHQAFVPPERFLRARRLAREMFGPQNVWTTNAPDEAVVEFAAIARDEARLREFVCAHPPVLVGTAHRNLRRFLDDRPLDQLPPGRAWRVPHNDPGCEVEFARETIWELHIDPYDNIQTNCGVILGNARETRLLDLLERGPENANFISKLVADEGPLGLADFARREHGFIVPDRAVSKCDLCYTTRTFLRPHYPHILGPAEVYGE
ncbi:MAG TPA: radical SAM protein [Planctomycetota bacterium]|nr:radical SAM protein [Planctomycetota bacterium]